MICQSRSISDSLGEWTKKDGIGIIQPGKPGVNRVMWDDAFYGPVKKANKAMCFCTRARPTKIRRIFS